MITCMYCLAVPQHLNYTPSSSPSPLAEMAMRWARHSRNSSLSFETAFNCLLFFYSVDNKVRKKAKIRNRYNQAPYLTKDTNGKVTTSQLDITNESREVSSFPGYPTLVKCRKMARFFLKSVCCVMFLACK